MREYSDEEKNFKAYVEDHVKLFPKSIEISSFYVIDVSNSGKRKGSELSLQEDIIHTIGIISKEKKKFIGKIFDSYDPYYQDQLVEIEEKYFDESIADLGYDVLNDKILFIKK